MRTMLTWKDISGWFLDCEGDALQEVCRDKYVLEIGAWQGRSTICIAEVAKAVITIEHFLADDSIRKFYPQPRSPNALRADLEQNLQASGVAPLVTVIDGPWEEHLVPCLGNRWFSGGPDVVFYDADHRWQSLSKFTNLMRPYKGTICIHDYGKPDPEWKLATAIIDRFAKVTDRTIRVVGSLAIMQP